MESFLVFLLRVGTAVYHVSRIILDLWIFVVTSMINRAFRSFQCSKNLYKQDPKEFLLSKLDEAKSYDEWYKTSLQLDKMEGFDKWRLDAESDLYDWKQLIEHLRCLRECRAKGDQRFLEILLRISCNRNFCNLSSTELFATSRVGTKRLIEEYEDEVCEALKDMCFLFDEVVNNFINLHNERMDIMDTIELNKYVLNHDKPEYSYPEDYMMHWLPSICGALPYSRSVSNENRKMPHGRNTRNINKKKINFPSLPERKIGRHKIVSSDYNCSLIRDKFHIFCFIRGARLIFSPIIKLKRRRQIQSNVERKIRILRKTQNNFIRSDNWIDMLSAKKSTKLKGEARKNKRKNIVKNKKIEQLHKVTKQVQTDESIFPINISYAVCENSTGSLSHLSTPSNNLASTILVEREEFEENEECFNATLQLEIENMNADDSFACGANVEFLTVDENVCETDENLLNHECVDAANSCIEECSSYSADKTFYPYDKNNEALLGGLYRKSKICYKLLENSGVAAAVKLNEQNSSAIKNENPAAEWGKMELGELKRKCGKNNFLQENNKSRINDYLLHDRKLLTSEIKQSSSEEVHGKYNLGSLNSLSSTTKASYAPSYLDLDSLSFLLPTTTDGVATSSALFGCGAKNDTSNISTSSPPLSCYQSLPSFISRKSFTNSYKDAFNIIHKLRNFFTDMRLSMGRTALCLSGGGALAMYHIGVVKTLVEQGLLPRVISGASGGSIVAALLARYTDEELLSEILKPTISQKYGLRWFPPVIQQFKSFLTKGCMVDPAEFEKTCKAYFQDLTFSECLEKTGRLVSIVVTPAGRHHAEPLVLNCINTPDVLLWSAVAVSCALPGLLPPSEIMSKNGKGEIVPYFPQGLKWIDGSIKSDIPQKELSCLFNIKEFIVSQVNPHAAPFVKTNNCNGQFLRSIENWLTLDIKSRYSVLTQFNMVPKIFGQNISTFWMMQEFEGHVTITPPASFSDWYRLINHPSEEDMRYFICVGESRTWPFIPRIKHMLKIEQELRKCWSRIEASYARLKAFHITSVLKQKNTSKTVNFPCKKIKTKAKKTTNENV